MDIAPQTALDPGQWLNRHGDALYRFARLSVRDSSAAEDLVQETLLAALQAQDAFDGRASERTWLIAVLRRKVADYFRRAARGTADSDDKRDDPNAAWFTRAGKWRVGPAEWDIAAADSAAQREFPGVLRACLEALPERMAAAVALRDLSDLDPVEICKIMSLSATNLSTLLHRARMRLRDCLEKKWLRPQARS